MNKLILLIIIAFVTGSAHGGQISIHTFTAHIPVENSVPLKSFTPGIGYTTGDFRIGYLPQNSFGVPSFYTARLYNYNSKLRFGMGIVSGYKLINNRMTGDENSIAPLLAAEYDITRNVSILWMGTAFNLELKF